MRNASRFIGISLIGAAMATANAQTTVTGDITGHVTDPSGAAVAGAKVTLTSLDQGTTRTITTDKNGDYRFSLLRPGTYRVDESGMGMSAASQVSVNVGQATTVNLSAKAGTTAVSVEVDSGQPLLQVEDANISTTFSLQQMQDLPLAGGDLTSTVLTVPGVVLATGGGLSSNFFAFGLPGTGNLFTLNGADLMDPYYNVNNSGASNNSLGANEVMETAIVANGYTGQYGRLPGVNVNFTTKSGTNKFHGTGLYAYNGSFLNARDWFNVNPAGTDPRSTKPKTIANQWGADIGGFLWKDKIFGYFDDEGLRYVSAAAAVPIKIPTAAFQTAVLANIAANQPAQLAFYKQVFALYAGANGASRATAISVGSDPTGGCQKFAGVLGGTTFGTGATPCAATFNSTNNNLNTEQLFAARLDTNLGAKDKAFFRYHHDWGVQATGTDPINTAFSANSVQPEWDGQFNETHVFSPNIVNNFTAAGSYYKAIFGPPNYSAAVATFPTTLAFTGSFTRLGGSDYAYPSGRNVAQYQFVDDLSVTHGKNSFKAGANFRRNNFALFSNQAYVNGLTTISNMTDFVNGTISLSGNSSERYGFPAVGAGEIGFYSLGIYVQDQYAVSNSLKLTLSLRGDRNSDPTCKRNCFVRLASPFYQLNHTATTPYNQAILTGQSNPYPSVTSFSIQPRIGFAYAVGGSSGKTVIRGGVGQFIDSPLLAAVSRFTTAAPVDPSFTIKATSAATPLPIYAGAPGSAYQQAAASNQAFQSGFSSGLTLAQIQTNVKAAGSTFSTPSYAASVDPKIKNPQYLEWNLELQHSFTSGDAFDINYVGNYGHDILFQDGTGNGSSATGFGGLPTVSPDSRFSFVTTLTNRAHSNYNGLTVAYRHQGKYGLTTSVSYTYSKALGTISNGGLYGANAGIDDVEGVVQIDPKSPSSLNYGPLDYDFRHNANMNYVWAIPYKGKNLLTRETLGGWTVSGVVFAKSGIPFSVYNSAAASTYTGNSINGNVLAAQLPGKAIGQCTNPYSACLSSTQFADSSATPGLIQQSVYGFGNRAQNSYRGPNFFDTDLRISKKITFHESYSFKFGATANNVLNHPNFSTPDNDVQSGTFGSIIQTVVSSPSSLYGNGQGSSPSGRVLALNAGFTF